ncbi:MAG TPA: DUF1559 domain-containing protein [Gemmataceae bacterium]|jgi:hypothetical protein
MYRITAMILALAFVVPAAAAEKKFDPDVPAKAIAPYLDDQVFGIGHADLTRIDFDKALAFFKELGKFEGKEIDEPSRQAREWLTAFLKAGGKDIYLVLSMADIPNTEPFFVVPMAEKANEEELAKLVGMGGQMKYLVIKKALVVGNEKTIDRLQDQKPAERPEVAKAFAAAGDTAAQFLLIPTEDSRKVIEQVAPPELPKELGGGSTKAFTRGVKWVAVGVNPPPKPSGTLVIQSQDADAAKELHAGLKQAVEAIGNLPADNEVKKAVPDLEKILGALLPQVQEDRLTLSVDEKMVTNVLGPVVAKIRDAAKRMQSVNNMKQIALAMHNYHDANTKFPAAYSVDKDGKPLLSWRVHILPYIEQDNLYKEFHLDEPWDSEHNKKLIPRMPKIYQSSTKLPEGGLTTYFVPVGDSTIFPGKDAVSFKDITDGTSNTVLLVDADDKNAAAWTRPEDLKVDPKKPEAGLAVRDGKSFTLAFADGSIHSVMTKIDKKTLWAIFTRNGGEAVTLPE